MSDYKSISFLKKTLLVFSLLAFIISAVFGIGAIFSEKNSIRISISDHDKRISNLESSEKVNTRLLLEIKYNLRQYFLQHNLNYVELK